VSLSCRRIQPAKCHQVMREKSEPGEAAITNDEEAGNQSRGGVEHPEALPMPNELTPPPPPLVCAVCRRGWPAVPFLDMKCRRCRAPYHYACWWLFTVPKEEARAWNFLPDDTPYLFFCLQCRPR
jgi:hypothetical protein